MPYLGDGVPALALRRGFLNAMRQALDGYIQSWRGQGGSAAVAPQQRDALPRPSIGLSNHLVVNPPTAIRRPEHPQVQNEYRAHSCKTYLK